MVEAPSSRDGPSESSNPSAPTKRIKTVKQALREFERVFKAAMAGKRIKRSVGVFWVSNEAWREWFRGRGKRR